MMLYDILWCFMMSCDGFMIYLINFHHLWFEKTSPFPNTCFFFLRPGLSRWPSERWVFYQPSRWIKWIGRQISLIPLDRMDILGVFQLVMGVPLDRWLVFGIGKILLKRMICDDSGNLHIMQYLWYFWSWYKKKHRSFVLFSYGGDLWCLTEC